MNFEENFTRCLQHVESRVESFSRHRPNAHDHLRAGTGSAKGCLSSLASYHEARAMCSWFRDRDPVAFHREIYCCAKLSRMKFQVSTDSSSGRSPFIAPLLSRDRDLLHWHCQNVRSLSPTYRGTADIDNLRKIAFYVLQLILALVGEFDLLARRAAFALQVQPLPKPFTLQSIDQKFWLALAAGDEAGMVECIAEATSTKVARYKNSELGLGLSEGFASLPAHLHLKAAWLNGFEIHYSSQWLQPEWLSVDFVEAPEDLYDFAADFDIFTPYEGEYAAYSPLPPGELCEPLVNMIDRCKKQDIY